MPHDLPPWEAVYQQMRRWIEAGVFEEMVHDLRLLLGLSEGRASEPTAAILDSSGTLHSTPESRGSRGGYSGERAAEQAEAHGISLEVVKYPEAKRGFVLLPRRWVVERDFAWASRFRRLVKDYERLPTVLAGLHFVAFACLFLSQATVFLSVGP
jgi:transposase